jgi:hypothetical protein
MRPHVVRPGEHLAGIAHRNGSDPTEVLDAGENAALKALRPGGHTLAPGDVVMLPPRVHPAPTTVAAGAETKVRATIPRTKIELHLHSDGAPMANEPWHVEASGEKASGTTGADGVVAFELRVTTKRAVLVLDRLGARREITIGGLDPVGTASGVAHRLRNLGLYGGDDTTTYTPALIDAVRRFQEPRGLTGDGRMDDATRDALVRAHRS